VFIYWEGSNFWFFLSTTTEEVNYENDKDGFGRTSLAGGSFVLRPNVENQYNDFVRGRDWNLAFFDQAAFFDA